MDKHTVLEKYFGHSQFRPGQEALIDGILAGRDVLGILPTGGGKSLCYQIPALLLPGMTVVVSPLISLMKDQVTALVKAGIPAACINSTLSADEARGIYRDAYRGAYRLLYVAPERLEAEGFSALTQTVPISLVAVDEAHCTSQWGQDFRPSYLRIAGFLAALPRRPVVAALTATATAQVQQDIVRLLRLEDPLRVITGFERPNLVFDVLRPRQKQAALLDLLRARRGKSGIIYCATRAAVERLCHVLCEAGFPATRYHAGLEKAERQRNQDDFQFDRRGIMVATNAFGMGIDKSNVSFVIHYHMPKSPEAYYQEAGRAGRDGARAECILLFSSGDVSTARSLIQSNGEDLDPETQALLYLRDEARLRAMVGYCQTTSCLPGYLLDYFGQPHAASCGCCGNCTGHFESRDITTDAQMILSCVLRVRKRLGYYVGRTLIVQTLRGSRDRRVLELGLDGLPTYGLLRGRTAGQLREMLDYLERDGYLYLNPLHATLEPAEPASAVLFRGATVQMPVRADLPAPRREKQPSQPAAAEEDPLYLALKAVRTEIAQAEHIPAYLVFSNATLADMAARAPRTMEEFRQVSGVGEVKAARYGEIFLRAIAAGAPPEI